MNIYLLHLGGFHPLFCIIFNKNKCEYINIKVSFYQMTSFHDMMVLS